MFKRAIVRTPCKNIINGLTTSNLGKPNFENALLQHKDYIKALEECGLEVTVLPPDDNYPDSTFVEDTALLTPHCAIISNPGAPSRKGEIIEMKKVLKKFYNNVEEISGDATVEPGDIMSVGKHYFIGLSKRTNSKGAEQLISILKKYNLSGSVVEMKDMLHLKTGLAYLENNNLVACGEFINKQDFQKYNIIKIDEDESYAANCVWINDVVLVPKGYPKAKAAIEKCGYKTREVDTSEFKKVDGGLSCLSLRF
ncbi:MAG: N(G),N(G)-dimethylarginine dimethylaminohydrolase [Melioribacteraceae bacterium]|nr:MAG: N(G),N(G)-dimethylarginine dimethylaminohydrolase [Melioribacteraceae bacterium]